MAVCKVPELQNVSNLAVLSRIKTAYSVYILATTPFYSRIIIFS